MLCSALLQEHRPNHISNPSIALLDSGKVMLAYRLNPACPRRAAGTRPLLLQVVVKPVVKQFSDVININVISEQTLRSPTWPPLSASPLKGDRQRPPVPLSQLEGPTARG